MIQLHWDGSEKHFEAALPGGKAVIDQVTQTEGEVYVPQLYDAAGQAIMPQIWLDDFTQAEAVVIAHLPQFDQGTRTQSEYVTLLSQALVQAEHAMANHPQAHQQRLRNIRAWVEAHGMPSFQLQGIADRTTQYETIKFNWEVSNGKYRMQTEFGTVEMVDVYIDSNPFTYGRISRYVIRVVDPSGVTLNPYLYASDFEQAESCVRQLLTDLSFPTVEETHCPYLDFVLDICQKRLPPQTDLMIFVRLEYVKNWLGESLP